MSSTMFRDRLGTVVRAVFDGNVNAAAVAARIEPSTLHRILEAKVSEPRLSTVQRLASAFGVPVGWLLGEADADQVQVATRTADETIVLPLPTDYWLILSFHRTKQERLREWLELAMPKSRAAREIAAGFKGFTLAVATDDSPFENVGDLVTPQDGRVGEAELSIVRRFAELESDVLELAVKLAKRAESKAE